MKNFIYLTLFFLLQIIYFSEEIAISLSIKPYWVYVTSSDGTIKVNNQEKSYLQISGKKNTSKTITFKKEDIQLIQLRFCLIKTKFYLLI
ncbi:MAG: hypothetical protein COB02_18240 [Candidatus Cloacimonadota bacterium]|nr:MAG: hypothetical protein COB02_18240 [Candidatus Cloacimonadota bacterium]